MSVNAVRTTTDANDHEHRYERRFEEHVKQKSVERGEYTVHEPGEEQKCRHVLRNALLDDLPPRDHDEYGGETVQQDQKERNAVDPEVVVHVERFDPWFEL